MKKSKILIVPAVLVVCSLIAAQSAFSQSSAPDILWQKSYGSAETDNVFSVKQTDDKGFVFAGQTGNGVWLVKTDAAGDANFTRAIVPEEGGPFASSVRQTADGGYIIVANSTFIGSSGSNIWVLKTDANGDTVWNKIFAFLDDGEDNANTVEQLSDGGYILYGNTTFESGTRGIWLLKIDAAGDTVWTKTFEEGVGSSDHELALTSDGGFIFTGQTGSGDVFVVKTDGNGNTVWSKIYDGGGADAGKSIANTSDGGYIVTGYTTVTGASANLWLIKIDADGNQVWEKNYGGAKYDEGRCVQQTADGGYFITGMTMSSGAGRMDAWILKTDASGDMTWTLTWGGSQNDQCYSGRQTEDGGYIVSVSSNLGASDVNGWLIKLDADEVSNRGVCMYVRQADNAETTPLDAAMVAHLTSWGYTVEEHYELDLPFYTDADYADFDFIFVSESINSGNAAPLKNIPKPMLLSEGRAPKESALCFAIGEPCGMPEGEPIVFLDEGAGHPLAAGYTPGTVLSLCDSTYLINWCQPTIPIIPIAGLESDPTQLIIYGVESGTLLADNTTRTQNRVAVIGVHAWGYTSFTEAAIKLYQAGIEWVLAGSGDGDSEVVWDFENDNDHGFTLSCVNPATPAADNPGIAGDEAITGVGGANGLPDAGNAWSIGQPNQYDGLVPAVEEGCHVIGGILEYTDCNDPFGVFNVAPPSYTNSRGQSSYLNTYNLSQWGDDLHSSTNDQIATSPAVLLSNDAVLTVWSHGGGMGTSAPDPEADRKDGYKDGSSGIAVLSAADHSLLASLHTNGKATLTEDVLDLSAFAGQEVLIEVVDAFQGGWGWLAVDEIRIANATLASTSVEHSESSGPGRFELAPNYPNPFNPETTIRFSISQKSSVSLKIYNMTGQEIVTLADCEYLPGNYHVRWKGDDNLGNKVPSGIYIYRMETEGIVKSNKMLLVK